MKTTILTITAGVMALYVLSLALNSFEVSECKRWQREGSQSARFERWQYEQCSAHDIAIKAY